MLSPSSIVNTSNLVVTSTAAKQPDSAGLHVVSVLPISPAKFESQNTGKNVGYNSKQQIYYHRDSCTDGKRPIMDFLMGQSNFSGQPETRLIRTRERPGSQSISGTIHAF